MTGFSLWGESAGARMAAWLGSLGTEYFGEQSYPRPAAVIMQYTGLSEVYGNEPPTYNCVGTNDGIASFKTMERRINAIKAKGTEREIAAAEPNATVSRNMLILSRSDTSKSEQKIKDWAKGKNAPNPYKIFFIDFDNEKK